MLAGLQAGGGGGGGGGAGEGAEGRFTAVAAVDAAVVVNAAVAASDGAGPAGCSRGAVGLTAPADLTALVSAPLEDCAFSITELTLKECGGRGGGGGGGARSGGPAPCNCVPTVLLLLLLLCGGTAGNVRGGGGAGGGGAGCSKLPVLVVMSAAFGLLEWSLDIVTAFCCCCCC